jgi:hypothetical protein
MRLILLFVFLALFSFQSFAQPMLTAGTSSPLPGDTASFYVYSGSAGDSGANITWDFSFLTDPDKDTVEYSDTFDCINSGTLGAHFTNEPWRCHNYGLHNDSFYYLGSGGGLTYIEYYDPIVILPYPITFDSTTYADTFNLVYYAEGLYCYGDGYQFIVADAYGTLILPDSTYTNVLRVKRSIKERFVRYDIPVNEIKTYQIFEWYSETASRTCLLKIQNHISTVEVKGVDLAIGQISVYPNPSEDIVFVKANSSVEVEAVILTDITGKSVYSNNQISSSSFSINVSLLPSGIYFLNIVTDKGALVKKLYVHR